MSLLAFLGAFFDLSFELTIDTSAICWGNWFSRWEEHNPDWLELIGYVDLSNKEPGTNPYNVNWLGVGCPSDRKSKSVW